MNNIFMHVEVIRIPHERVPIIIGKYGKDKKLLEKATSTKIEVNKEGEVSISGKTEGVYFCTEIVKAIGRGFSPKTALKLSNQDYSLEMIELSDFFHTKNSIVRVKGRVIGEKGKIKTNIENATDSFISIYGDTISVIAPHYSMHYAKEVISMLLRGARHSTIEHYLGKIKEELMLLKLRGEKNAI